MLETQNYIICSNVFVKKDNKYLMLRRSSKKSILPSILHPIGGKVEKNETPLDAMKRELLEESGLNVNNIQLKAIFFELISEKTEKEPYDWMNYYFVADYSSGEIIETDEGSFEWLTGEEIKKDNILRSVKKVIDRILTSDSGLTFCKFIYDKDDNMVDQKIDLINE